jgi:hypothetical protein
MAAFIIDGHEVQLWELDVSLRKPYEYVTLWAYIDKELIRFRLEFYHLNNAIEAGYVLESPINWKEETPEEIKTNSKKFGFLKPREFCTMIKLDHRIKLINEIGY